MSDRVSETIVLCEDDPQEQLVRRYLERCGLRTRPPTFIPKNSSRMVAGGGAAWVLNEFPKELDACRRRHTRANTLLIVIIDADNNSVAQRLGQLQEKKEVEQDDPLVVLIPRRHGETWIRSALGQVVNENDDYTNPEPRKSEIRGAADQIHGWARNNPAPGHTCVDSLRHSLPAWRTIG